MRSEPRDARISVWALPISLAATFGIDLSFFSSGYLDVSVHRVPPVYLWIQYTVHEGFSCGFPHSDIHGSRVICSSPWLFAAYHVFRRLLVPRHPPCALSSLTYRSGVRVCSPIYARSVGRLGLGSSMFTNLFLIHCSFDNNSCYAVAPHFWMSLSFNSLRS